jgi:hypothetical protein
MNVLRSNWVKPGETGQAGSFELKHLCKDGSFKDIEISTVG